MSVTPRPVPISSPAVDQAAVDPAPVLRGMRIGQHLLFGVLLLVGVVRAVESADARLAVLCGAVVVAAWYSLGVALAGRRGSAVTVDGWVRGRRGGLVWLAVLVTGWLLLVSLSVELSWVAFSLFFLAMHLLPVRAAVPVVVLLTGAVVVAQVSADGGIRPAQVLGPCLGAAVAVGMSLAYGRLAAVGEHGRQLVAQLVAAQDDLVATHHELVAAQREAGAQAERARLAREIHDTLAQGFSSVILLSRAALGRVDDDADDSGDVNLLRQIESTAVDNLEEARRVVRALAPAALDDVPLAAALGRLVDRLSQQTGVTGRLTVDGDLASVDTVREVALLRLAQGALANVQQHAGATRVVVTLSGAHDEVRLDVVDDGRGFEPARVDLPPPGASGGASGSGVGGGGGGGGGSGSGSGDGSGDGGGSGSGFGLRSMRERVEQLGGHLVVESVPGQGTAVAALLPIDCSATGLARP